MYASFSLMLLCPSCTELYIIFRAESSAVLPPFGSLQTALPLLRSVPVSCELNTERLRSASDDKRSQEDLSADVQHARKVCRARCNVSTQLLDLKLY